jgi:hypothetical protein
MRACPFWMKRGSLVLPFATLVSAGLLAAIEPSFSAEADAAPAHGCWAHLYELPGFNGDKLAVVGPVDLSAVERAAGRGWSGPRSLELGPGARLEATDASGQAKLTLAPGEDVPDFRNAEPPNLLGSLRDLRIACVRRP